MWRSTGFLMNFSVVIELACVVAYITILVGGRASREAGWQVLASLLGVVAGAQMVAMALVVRGYTVAVCGWCGRSADGCDRLISMIMTTGFLLGGSWISRGCCVR